MRSHEDVRKKLEKFETDVKVLEKTLEERVLPKETTDLFKYMLDCKQEKVNLLYWVLGGIS